MSTSAAVSATRSRKAKVGHLAACLAALSADDAPIAVAYLTGELPQGRIGVGYRAVQAAAERAEATAVGAGVAHQSARRPLEVTEVHAILSRVAAEAEPGSQGRRAELLDTLLRRADDEERAYLQSLLVGGLRQGALEGVMADALATAAQVPAAAIRRAAMVSGSLVGVGGRLLSEGAPALEAVRLQVLTPLQPMLAQSAGSCADALDRTGPASVEAKLDGARIQVHRRGAKVRVFTRNLRDVTAALPEVVAAVAQLEVQSAILDGEAIALSADGAPLPFQETMSRFSRQAGAASGVTGADAGSGVSVAVSPVFFDCLHLDGDDLIDLPAHERYAALDRACPHQLRVARRITDDAAEAERTLEETLAAGHEGVMVKSLSSRYEAGRRGVGWIKVKRAKTLDLVVLAVEWGSGRRSGKLSNLHLGARDEESGGFVMLGKTFKGMTDAMLAWQTARFLDLETERRGHVVYVRPEQIVEIAFDDVQASRRYPGGMALRFARVKGYRHDKDASAADTVATVRKLFRGGRGGDHPPE